GGVSKAELRAGARARLRAMTAAERARAGERVAARVWRLPELAAARTLLLYASLPEEVPTGPIAVEALRRGITVTYPRCLPATRGMTLHALADLAELRETGSYGILEPDLACPRLEVGE